MTNIDDYSTLLADCLLSKFPLAQIRRQMYITDDMYAYIPHLTFFLEETDEVYNHYKRLGECIEQFEGTLKWMMCRYIPSKRNYVIAPYAFFEEDSMVKNDPIPIAVSKMTKIPNYKEICSCAIKDIPSLVSHINRHFA